MISKIFPNRNFAFIALLSVFSFVLWCYLFKSFLDGSTTLQADAYPYFGEIRFYLDNMTHGIYPLWNPLENYGANEFFLRRIGEFNPFFWFIVLLNKCGLSFSLSYRLFLGAYFFLGLTGFYLLCQRFFRNQQSSFVACLLILFSTLGAKAFESYILLEVVPLLWFAYFILGFCQSPKKIFLLGAIFALMIINITYIPFYFYTILFVFILCLAATYVKQLKASSVPIKKFIQKHTIFTVLGLCLFLLSFVPGILWYQESSHGEAVTMTRHAGSQDKNPMTIGLNKVNEGGITFYDILDKQFVDLDKIRLGDFYLPLFAYLMLFAGVWQRLNRRLVTLFIFGFLIFLIGLADGTYIHKFLYNAVPLFKYFRNLQFFLWLALLPVLVLFVVEQMRLFVNDCAQSLINRKWLSIWVLLIHLGATVLFLCLGTSSFAAYAVILFSLLWMLGQLWSFPNARALTFILWAAIIIQPFEVLGHCAAVYPPSYLWDYSLKYNTFLPSKECAQQAFKREVPIYAAPHDMAYFNSPWYYQAFGAIDPTSFRRYQALPFIVYDHTENFTDDKTHRLEHAMDRFSNIAFVSSDDASPTSPHTDAYARIITNADNDFKILKIDANDVVVKADFDKPKFLVRTQNYHSQWMATIDGKPASIIRTNILDQGLWVPAGEHTIAWHFAPWWRYAIAYFFVGLYIVILGWIIRLCF